MTSHDSENARVLSVTVPRVRELLERARSRKVLVVGDLMLDRYVWGSAERISPEAPIPVVRAERETVVPGGAANVAAGIAALGVSCSVVGVVGDDVDGRMLLDELGRRVIAHHRTVVAAGRPTTTKTRIMAGSHQVSRWDRECDAFDPRLAEAVVDEISASVEEADVVVVADYDKGLLNAVTIPALLASSRRRRRVPLIVDPKERNFRRYLYVTVLKPNVQELAQALRTTPCQALAPGWGQPTRRDLLAEHLLVTRGAGGMSLASPGAEEVRIPAATTHAVDVSGAGDTVSAALATVMAAGGTVYEAAVIANAAASVVVERVGVSTVSAEEVIQRMAERIALEPAGLA